MILCFLVSGFDYAMMQMKALVARLVFTYLIKKEKMKPLNVAYMFTPVGPVTVKIEKRSNDWIFAGYNQFCDF